MTYTKNVNCCQFQTKLHRLHSHMKFCVEYKLKFKIIPHIPSRSRNKSNKDSSKSHTQQLTNVGQLNDNFCVIFQQNIDVSNNNCDLTIKYCDNNSSSSSSRGERLTSDVSHNASRHRVTSLSSRRKDVLTSSSL